MFSKTLFNSGAHSMIDRPDHAAELAALLCLQLSAANRRGVRTDELSASELVVTSAFSKMVASTITYPHEVVRSYMHVTGAA